MWEQEDGCNDSKWQTATEMRHSSYSELLDWKHNCNFMSCKICLEKLKSLTEGCK